MLPVSKALCEHFAFPAHRDPAKCGGWGCSTRPWPSVGSRWGGFQRVPVTLKST